MQLSIFTDEIGVDITEGVSILAEWGMKCVDFRSRTFGKATETLDTDELAELKKLVDSHGMKVTCLQSSLAKVHLPDADRLEAEKQKLENIIRAADVLDCRLVRAFHYWQPKGDERGCLDQRPDMMQKVLDVAGPLCTRAKEAGLVFGFENCGVGVDEIFAFVEALGIPEFGLAWDPANEWLGAGDPPDGAAIARRARATRIVHVKAAGIVPGLHKIEVPWGKLLLALATSGYGGPVSIETHNPDKSQSNRDVSKKVFDRLCAVWPGQAPVAAKKARFEFEPVRFVVVGLGMGANRAKDIQRDSGVELAGVCDINAERAEKVGTDLGVEWTTDLGPWLGRDDVEAAFVVTETGHHGKVAVQALEAGKHVIVTKPMDANAAACDRMIEAAEKAGKILAVDFSMRLNPAVRRMKRRIDSGDLGRLLGGNMSLKVRRAAKYFAHNNAWRGTWALDGGGAMSNQNIHHLDELIYVLGMPRRVSMGMWTQDHDIEAEDLACGLWEYEGGAVVQVAGTTCYPQSTWYHSLELHGTEGAMVRAGGGPFATSVERWFTGGVWEDELPPAPEKQWDSLAQNLAAAIRTGAPLVCDGPDGRRSRRVLDAMYHSARSDGKWVDVPNAK